MIPDSCLRHAPPTSSVGFLSAALALAASILTSCVSGTPAGRPAPRRLADLCLVVLDSTVPPPDTLAVALTEPLRPFDEAWPPNDAERLVFRQLYETLVRVDCTGRVWPALAERWDRDSTGRHWTFTLRRGLRFADGTPLNAPAVRASWERGREDRSWRWPAIADVEAADALTLEVRLAAPHPTLPSQFADPGLAVAGARRPDGWRAESGGYRIVAMSGESRSPASLALVPATGVNPGPVIRVLIEAGADPRDLLDDDALGADVVLTRDPAALAYARSRDDLQAFALPWDRTYVHLAPLLPGVAAAPAPEAREALARDAVPGDARGAAPPFWWDGDALCRARGPILSNPGAGIAFQRDDPVARSLAERILVLATSRNPPEWLQGIASGSALTQQLRVLPLDRRALDSVLSRGGVARSVVFLPRLAPAGCQGLPPRPIGFAEVPLVDTRASLILRHGVPSLSVDGDGLVRFLPSPLP